MQTGYDYNTSRPQLLLTEYGRNVQNMIKFIIGLEDRDERNKYAQAVIELMGFLNPHLRDVTDFKHKLWDHLFVISDFKLDVDSPYPIPSRDTLISKPLKVPYPADRIHFKHYGKTVELMIAKAKLVEDIERRSVFVAAIANFMKMAYVNWNKDSVTDETIINDLKILSKGELELGENTNLAKVEFRPPPRTNNNPRHNGKKNNQNSGNPNNRKRNNNQNGKRF
jgi:hypothetical protein